MTKAVIFDLDGTLLDTLQDLHDSVNFALSSEKLPERSLEEVRRFVGNGIRKLIERAVPDDCSTETEEKVFAVFKEHYMQNCKNTTKAYPRVDELLEKLKSSGVKLGVVSNKADPAVKELVDYFFPEIFDTVCGEKENVRKKPEPDAVFESMKQLCVAGADTVYVGDSDVDFNTAKNADIKCVMVSWGFKDRDVLVSLGAELIADDTEKLYKILIEIFRGKNK